VAADTRHLVEIIFGGNRSVFGWLSLKPLAELQKKSRGGQDAKNFKLNIDRGHHGVCLQTKSVKKTIGRPTIFL
jgi:hypothetical protein